MPEMKECFSGEPLTQWDGSRNMTLKEDFYYIDPDGKKWDAPEGSCINGATIPRALWSSIGSPYTGKYRRASVVHDVAVGELSNEDVSQEERKKADRMFYHACKYDGCSNRFAILLYIGVRLGTWISGWSSPFDKATGGGEYEEVRDNPEFDYTRKVFWQIVDEGKNAIKNEDLDLLDEIIDKRLS